MGTDKRASSGGSPPSSSFCPCPLISNISIRKFDSPRLGLLRRVSSYMVSITMFVRHKPARTPRHEVFAGLSLCSRLFEGRHCGRFPTLQRVGHTRQREPPRRPLTRTLSYTWRRPSPTNDWLRHCGRSRRRPPRPCPPHILLLLSPCATMAWWLLAVATSSRRILAAKYIAHGHKVATLYVELCMGG
jgi:hypothetical protein